MERLKVYMVKKGLANFSIVFGILFLVVGLVLLIQTIKNKSSVDWNSITFSLEGILFIVLGYLNLRSGKYFIEWDENQINYSLPNNSSIETILFSEIRNVTIKLFEIQLKLEDSEKIINLENLQFQEIKSVKQKFEEIKTATVNRS